MNSKEKKNVYDIHKIRTMAAQKVWESATLNSEDAQKAQEYQQKTKKFAREWLDYAKSTKQSTSLPKQICISAAKKDFCQ